MILLGFLAAMGVAWMLDRADSLGRPAVVNISLGTLLGPHDGTSLMEQALDALSGPGRIIVTSAGNDGNAHNTDPPLTELLVHARAAPGPGVTEEVQVRLTGYVPSSQGCNDFVLLDVWYGGDQEVTFEVERPDGSTAAATTGAEVVSDHPPLRRRIPATGTATPPSS